jgi:putative transposase
MTYLLMTLVGQIYIYLMIDVWSRLPRHRHYVVASYVIEREDPAIAADLVARAFLRERISKGRKQPPILHADNGNAMCAAAVETRLDKLGVFRSFSFPRFFNDTPYSEALFRTVR